MIRRRGIADGRQVVPGAWIDDINEGGDPQAWARSDLAEMFPQASYRSKWYQIDRSAGMLCAIGILPAVDLHPSRSRIGDRQNGIRSDAARCRTHTKLAARF